MGWKNISVALRLRDSIEALRKSLTSINHDRLPGYVSCLLRCEKQCCITDVFNCPELFERDGSRHGTLVLWSERHQALSPNVAREYCVDRDAVVGQFDAGRPHESKLTSLCRTVVTPAWKPCHRSGDRGCKHDPALI